MASGPMPGGEAPIAPPAQGGANPPDPPPAAGPPIDLKTINPAASAGSGGGDGGAGTAVDVQPYVLNKTRERLAYIVLGILGAVMAVEVIAGIIFSSDCWFNATQCDVAKSSLGILLSTVSPMFTAMVGLVGSVIGFYFGSQQSTK